MRISTDELNMKLYEFGIMCDVAYYISIDSIKVTKFDGTNPFYVTLFGDVVYSHHSTNEFPWNARNKVSVRKNADYGELMTAYFAVCTTEI